jgi:invasion protein IalB
MRRCLFIAAMLAVLISLQNRAASQTPQPSYDPLRHGRALLIGNSQYKDGGWPTLDDIPLQLTALEMGLRDHFDTVEVVQNLDTEQLRQKINSFVRVYGNDSGARLFIYYAGHGYTELIPQRNEYRGYITGVDTPSIDGTSRSYAAARLKAISMMEIRVPLAEVPAKQILFVFDSCFAGTIFTTRGPNDLPSSLTPQIVTTLLEKPARDFITAGRANEAVPAHSPLTEVFLAALSGKADRYGHGVISTSEIHLYLLDRILPLQLQGINLTPQAGRLPDPSFAEGEFLFRIVKPDFQMASRSEEPKGFQVSPGRVPDQAVAPGSTPELPKLVYSPWARFCDKGQEANAKNVCFTGKDARTEAGLPVVAAALIEPDGDPKKLFRVTLPSPLQMQSGTRIVIDQQAAISGPFFTCIANGCMADYEATADLIGKLKKGQTVNIQAINLNGKAISFPLSLVDFAKANEGPPTDPRVFQEAEQKKGGGRASVAPVPQSSQDDKAVLVYSPWARFCGKGQEANAKNVCFTGKDARTEAGLPVVAAALIEPDGDPKKLFRVTLPSPLQTKYGARITIDQQAAISGPFFTCFANGCMADYEATPDLIGKLKKGQTVNIQAVNLAGKTISFPLPLVDFAKANEGPPIDPKVFEEQQKKLQEQITQRGGTIRSPGNGRP